MRIFPFLILLLAWRAFAFDGAFEAYLKGNKKCLFQKQGVYNCEGVEVSFSSNETYSFQFKNLKRAHVDKWSELSRKIDLTPIFKNKTAEYSALISKTISNPEYNTGKMISLCLKGDSLGCDISFIVRPDNDNAKYYFLITDVDSTH